VPRSAFSSSVTHMLKRVVLVEVHMRIQPHARPRVSGKPARSPVEALIRFCKQPLGIFIQVSEAVDNLCGDPQSPDFVTTQQPGMKRGAGEEFVPWGLAQRELQARLDAHLTGRQVLPFKYLVHVVLLVHESSTGCKKVTQAIRAVPLVATREAGLEVVGDDRPPHLLGGRVALQHRRRLPLPRHPPAAAAADGLLASFPGASAVDPARSTSIVFPIVHLSHGHRPLVRCLSQPWGGGEPLKGLFAHYVETKQAQTVLDYDDLLLYWSQMMQIGEIGRLVSERFDHVLVDEYQDTNALQASILLGLKPDGAGITVVGDDAQAIYSFRSATVRNILDFPSRFDPPAEVVRLEQNYRST
jgi:UvrD/REP helicase N-terminal domain